eukprot:gene750-9002_t
MPRLSTFSSEILPTKIFEQLEFIGIKSVEHFMSISIKDLLTNINSTDKELKEIKKKLVMNYLDEGISGEEFFSSTQKNLQIYRTECAQLNSLISGGVYTGEILEVSGPSFSGSFSKILTTLGKTQFCLSQTLFVSSKTKGTVIYIDTNNSFSDTRLREMHLEFKNKDPEILPILVSFRDKIKIFKLYNIDSFLNVLNEIIIKIKQGKDKFYSNLRLIVIDSINVILGPHEMKKKLFLFMSQISILLKTIASEYDIAIIITNNSVADFEGDKKLKPALGENWKHISNTQLFLDYKIVGDSIIERDATLLKSATFHGYLKSCKFEIDKIGIVDCE